jgi:exonuclease III
MAAHKINSFKIASFNVNGINSFARRQRIFTLLNDENFDIIYLQETHIFDPVIAEAAKREWQGQSVWSLGAPMSKGVAVLFNKRLVFKLT